MLFSYCFTAQEIHTLSKGKEVIINKNGTWKTKTYPSPNKEEVRLQNGKHIVLYKNGTWKWKTYPSPNKELLRLKNGTPIVLYSNGKWKKKQFKKVAMEKVFVKGGSFDMGSNENDDETPIHKVTVSDFYIGKYEVTNAQYAAFLNAKGNQKEGGETWIDTNSDYGKNYCQIEEVDGIFQSKVGKEDYPVVCVTWYGARAYAKWVEGRLPTEAEWEYAAQGGNNSKGYKYSGGNTIDDVAWYDNNSHNPDNDMYGGKGTHKVGTKQPNELGIYDMSGNVWEWCNDWYYENYYSNSPTLNPQGASSGKYRVLRGGSWINRANNCRIGNRDGNNPNISN